MILVAIAVAQFDAASICLGINVGQVLAGEMLQATMAAKSDDDILQAIMASDDDIFNDDQQLAEILDVLHPTWTRKDTFNVLFGVVGIAIAIFGCVTTTCGYKHRSGNHCRARVHLVALSTWVAGWMIFNWAPLIYKNFKQSDGEIPTLVFFILACVVWGACISCDVIFYRHSAARMQEEVDMTMTVSGSTARRTQRKKKKTKDCSLGRWHEGGEGM